MNKEEEDSKEIPKYQGHPPVSTKILKAIFKLFGKNSGKKNHKINKWKLVMKLHWDIINKDFNEKLDIVEEDCEEILPK